MVATILFCQTNPIVEENTQMEKSKSEVTHLNSFY